MLKLLIDNTERQLTGKPTLTNNLSGLDVFVFNTIQETSNQVETIKNSYVQLFDDTTLLFDGYVQTEGVVHNDSEQNRSKTVLNKLSLLQNQYFYAEIQPSNVEIIAFLNQNPSGILFKNYNLYGSNKYFTDAIRKISWYSQLVELSRRFGFEFWWSYTDNCCYLGNPNDDKIEDVITLTQDSEKCILPTQAGIDYGQVFNEIFVFGGLQDTLSLDLATASNPNYPIKNKLDTLSNKTVYYIEDTTSKANYGIKQDIIAGVNFSSNNTNTANRTAYSNIMYSLAVERIIKHKDPLITINNVNYLAQDYTELTLNKIFKCNFAINGIQIIGNYLIKSSEWTIDNATQEGVRKLQLINFIDKTTPLKKLLDVLAQKTDTVLSTSNQSIPLSQTFSVPYSFAGVSYSLNNAYKYLNSYSLNITVNQLNTGNFTISSLTIDGVELINFLSSKTINTIGSITNTVDIHNSSLSASQKALLEDTASNHTILINGTGTANISVSYTINASGYV